MEFFGFIGWLLLNVGVPLLAPIALLPLLATGRRQRATGKALIRRSVQEGQLFWPVIAMCSAAWYEATGLLGTARFDAVIGWAAIGWHVLIIVVSAVLVSLCTIDAVEDEIIQASPIHGTGHPLSRAVLTSIWCAVAVSITFSATHYWAR